MRNRLASSAVALLLVLAAVGGGLGPASVTQTASAEWSEECSFASSLIGAAYNTVIGANDGCRWIAGDSTDYENITKTNAVSSLYGVKDGIKGYTTTVSNFQANSRTVAYSKGKIDAVRNINNGTGPAQSKNDANTSVEDYYSRSIQQAITDWNSKATQLQYLNNQSSEVQVWLGNYEMDPNATTTAEFTLPNGTAANVTVLTDTQGNTLSPRPDADVKEEIRVKVSGDWSEEPGLDPMINMSTTYEEIISEAEFQSQQVKDNLAPYIEELHAQYSAGEITSEDLAAIDPAVIGQEASTSFNSTGYYGHAGIMLASIGAAGDINTSHTVVVTDTANGTTTELNGTLYFTGEGDAGKTWENNVTYGLTNNATPDVNNTVYMAVSGSDGQGRIVDLSNLGDTFEITRATNTQTGESVNKTVVNRYTYDSTNASALAEEIERLEQLRERYEDQQSNNGGIPLGTEDKAIIGVIAAVVLVLALRD